MRKFLFWRLVQFPIVLSVIYLLAFVLVWIVPGSPLATERARDAESMRLKLASFHADTWYNFLAHYPIGIVTRLDFGPSMKNQGFSVGEMIGSGLPVSMTVGFLALTVAVIVGVAMGTLSAVRRDGIIDWLGIGLAVVGISVPSFVVASLLLLAFSIHFHWFPLSGASGVDDLFRLLGQSALIIGPLLMALLTRNTTVRIVAGALALAALIWLIIVVSGSAIHLDRAGTQLYQIILPSLALSLAPMAYIVRLQRVSMLDTLGSDYVRTARAKGVSKPTVVITHCLRNAFLPVFTYLGPAAAGTLTGSFVVETIFNLPGLGQFFVSSVLSRDQTMILGLVLVYSSMLLAFNLLVDVGYAFIDPRIDVTAKK